MTWLTSSSPGTVTTTRSRFRNDLITPSSSGCATTRTGSSFAQPPRSSAAALVESSSSEPGSTTPSVPACACAESALRSAALRLLRFTFDVKLRLFGGNAMPPPVQCGARVEPARARPVPFWRHGFERPPATRPRLLPPRVAERASFSSARTVSWTRCGFTSAPKTPSSSVTLFEEPRTWALGAATTLVLSHFHEPVLGPGDGALDQEQVPLRIDLVHRQPDLGDALAAHAAGHADPLEDARGRRRGTDRARLPDVVRAVRHRAAREVVALDRAGEALADPGPRDLHVLAGLEGLDRDRLAGSELAWPAELREPAVRAGLAELAEPRLRHPGLGHRVEGELDGLVAVGLDGLHADDRIRPGLDHRHRRHLAGLRVEDLGHAELLAEDAFHSLISMSTPAGRSSRISESTVFGVGEWMSIRRLCVRTSKCSRESLSLNGLRITQ